MDKKDKKQKKNIEDDDDYMEGGNIKDELEDGKNDNIAKNSF